MTTMNIEGIREELAHLLRNGDVLTIGGITSISVRGVTTTTDSFTATAGQTVFNLAHTGVKNIRSITVNSVAKYLFRDFTMNWTTGVLTLNTGATLSDPVVVQYDYSSVADKIYPDMPRDDLTLASYPRVGIELTSSSTEPLGLGGMTHISDFMVTIFIWVPVNKDSNVSSTSRIGGTSDLSTIMKNVRDTIRTNAKSLYYIPYIHPVSTSPIIKSINNKIIQQSEDFVIKFLVE